MLGAGVTPMDRSPTGWGRMPPPRWCVSSSLPVVARLTKPAAKHFRRVSLRRSSPLNVQGGCAPTRAKYLHRN